MTTGVRILGHRGFLAGGEVARENTVAAYRRAVAAGADGVELDVRLARDGSLLLHHDPHTADGRSIADMTEADRPEWMPTLEEALDAVAGSLVNIEIKNIPYEPSFDPSAAVVDAVVATLAARPEGERVLVSSFHPDTVDRVKAVAPQIPTAVLSWIVPSAPASVDIAIAGGHDAVHPHVDAVDAAFVRRAHDAGLEVNVWTVNDPATALRLVEIGVDGLVTDEVLALVRALRGE